MSVSPPLSRHIRRLRQQRERCARARGRRWRGGSLRGGLDRARRCRARRPYSGSRWTACGDCASTGRAAGSSSRGGGRRRHGGGHAHVAGSPAPRLGRLGRGLPSLRRLERNAARADGGPEIRPRAPGSGIEWGPRWEHVLTSSVRDTTDDGIGGPITTVAERLALTTDGIHKVVSTEDIRRCLVDGGLWAGLAVALLGTACVAVPAVAPLEVRVLATGLGPVAGPEPLAGALKEPWVLQPVHASSPRSRRPGLRWSCPCCCSPCWR